MNLKSSNKISANEYELEIEISADVFNKEIDKVYKRDIKKINVPGFRKGKAPRPFVEKYYGEGVFYEDAIKGLYPKAIEDAIKEININLVDVTKFDILTSNKKEGLVFKVIVVAEPEIKLGNYKGIEVEKLNLEVTQEDIDKEIEEVRVRNGRLVTVESRPAQMGDIVTIDFEGFIEGKPFEGGKAENLPIELGKKQFIEGFEEQIVGHNSNEVFEIKVTFPEEYHNEKYAGKPATFKINLHEIKERELPDLDDEFVKDISEFDTLDEYKEDLKKSLKVKKEEQNKSKREEEIEEKLAKLVEADIPDVMIQKKIDELIKNLDNDLRSQGLGVQDYVKFAGLSIDKIREQFHPTAERQVKFNLAIKKIIEEEKFACTDEEIESEYKKMGEIYKVQLEKVKEVISKEEVEEVINRRKAVEIVENNVVVI